MYASARRHRPHAEFGSPAEAMLRWDALSEGSGWRPDLLRQTRRAQGRDRSKTLPRL